MPDRTIKFSLLEGEASSEHTPASRLTELARQSIDLARIVAKNPTVPPDLLTELGRSEDELTRRNVTQNPNTPLKFLFRLGESFPDELLDNPIFPLLSLENPNWVEMLPKNTAQAFLSHPRAQQALLEGFRNHPHQGWLFSIWRLETHDLPIHWLEEFSRSIDESVRYGAAKNPKTPISLLKQLARNTSDRVRYGVARNPKTPISLLEKLARDTSEMLREGVAANPKTPVALLEKLATDSALSVNGIAREQLKNRKNLCQIVA